MTRIAPPESLIYSDENDFTNAFFAAAFFSRAFDPTPTSATTPPVTRITLSAEPPATKYRYDRSIRPSHSSRLSVVLKDGLVKVAAGGGQSTGRPARPLGARRARRAPRARGR